MSTIRISGMASGMDTDSMIKSLMKAESSRVNKVKQDKQLALWQQSAFRDAIGKLKSLQSTFFDVLKPGSNLASGTSFGKFNYSILSGGATSNAVNITAGSGVTSRNVVIEHIDEIATKDLMTGAETDLKGIKSEVINMTDLQSDLAGSDLEFTLAIGSTSKVISVDNAAVLAAGSVEDLQALLKTQITEAFGSDYQNVVSVSDGQLKFDMTGSQVRMIEYNGNANTFTALGLTSGVTNVDYRTKSIGELFAFDAASVAGLEINGKPITISETDTIDLLIDKVNKSGAGVTLSYDALSDRFKMQSQREGSANNISIVDGSSSDALFSKLFNVGSLNALGTDPLDGSSHVEALNAKLTINGQEIIQSSNEFSFDGINYSLKAKSATAINVGISINSTQIVDNIKNFVTEYNKIIDSLTSSLSEKKYYEYKPLTDEEKDSMSEDEIKLWEDKAKSGVLKGSSELNSFLSRMRNALISPVAGSSISLHSIGISSTSYLDQGKLTINEDQLKTSIDTNYEEVVKLFSAQSDAKYSETTRSAERYSENGIGSRVEDILKDYVRTTRDSNSRKGILIERAGIEGDLSNTTNTISSRIKEYDDRITILQDYLITKESYYYTMFSKMESAMSKMNSQSASMSNMFGTSA